MPRRLSIRVYALLLHLYPAQFRQDYGHEVLLVFRREIDWYRTFAGRLFYLLCAAGGILLNAPKEHFHMLFDDLRYGLRSFLRSPWFTLVAIATLALGIGVNSALFSVVKSVLLEDLPYDRPNQLVRVWIRNPKQGFDHDISNLARMQDWKLRGKSFQDLAGFTGARLILTGGQEPLQLQGASVTANFFRVMGVRPLLGRDFEEGDDQLGRPRKIILSHGLWLRQFGGDPSIVGRQLPLSGDTYQVAAVLPPFVRFPQRDLDFWSPLMVDDAARRNRSNFWLNVVGRLRDGVTLSRAQAEMDTLARTLTLDHPEDRDLGLAVVSLKDDLTGPIRPALTVLGWAVVFILLICCANIAGMLSARVAARAQELSIRAALGAGRNRVVRQLLTEALALFSLGGAVGIAVAYAGVAVLLRLAPAELPQLQDTRLDLTVAAFTLAVSAACGLVFGLLPALQASGLDVAHGLRLGARGIAGRLDHRRFRSVLTIGEMALAMMLLTGAWLLLRSFQLIEHVPPGFDSGRVSIAQLQLPRTRYPEGRQSIDFFQRLIDRLQHTPGIDSASAISTFFLGRLPNSGSFVIEGRPETISTPLTTDSVTPEFFSMMRIPLRKGRFFDSRDRADSTPVVIVNETMARRYWPNADPIGRRITFADPSAKEPHWLTIVGIVADTRRAGTDQPVFTESYGPLSQSPDRSMQVLIRGNGARAALQSAVHAIDPNQPVVRFANLDTALADQVASRRFTTFLLTLFAATALAITGVGLYGLISYLVTQRRQEFGIRVALGAQPADVLRIVVSRVSLLAAAGLMVGTLGALAVTRLLDGLLFGITRFDVASYLSAASGLLLVCLAAAVSPAVRAVRVDPLTTLRTE